MVENKRAPRRIRATIGERDERQSLFDHISNGCLQSEQCGTIDACETNGIGYATISAVSEDNAVGFGAAVYSLGETVGTLASGSSVISFRGTDDVLDPIYGWAGQLGDPYTAQAARAGQVYQQVADDTALPIIMTGHSLGGGLAGLIASIHGERALLVANMGFEAVAEATYENSTENADTYQQALRAHMYGDLPIQAPDSSNISSIYIEGEGATPLRLAQQTAQTGLELYSSPLGGALTPIELHSSALHVILTYADANSIPTSNWTFSMNAMLGALYSGDAAVDAGFDGVSGTATARDKLMMGIAYSAIGEGNAEQGATFHSPFGDTAIVAFFDDASNLNDALVQLNISAALSNTTQLIADIAVGYAGRLALHGVEAVERAGAKNGVLQSGTNGNCISVDLRDSTWTFDGVVDGPACRTEFIQEIVNSSSTSWNQFESALGWFANETGQQASAGLVKSVLFQTAPLLPLDSSPPLTGMDLNLVVPYPFDQTVINQGGNAIILGTDSSDFMEGASGHDILIGGAGEDYLRGGGGADYIRGGAGADIIFGDGGDDLIIFDGGADYIDGGGGNDTIMAGDPSTGSSIDLQGTTITGIELVQGSDHDDVLKSNGSGIVLHGGGGDDILYGFAGDTLTGGDGEDIFHLTSFGAVKIVENGVDTAFNADPKYHDSDSYHLSYTYDYANERVWDQTAIPIVTITDFGLEDKLYVDGKQVVGKSVWYDENHHYVSGEFSWMAPFGPGLSSYHPPYELTEFMEGGLGYIVHERREDYFEPWKGESDYIETLSGATFQFLESTYYGWYDSPPDQDFISGLVVSLPNLLPGNGVVDQLFGV